MKLFKKKKDSKLLKVKLSPAEMFYTNALSIEALVNVLESKNILKKEEVLNEIKRLGKERKDKMEELNEDIRKSK
ncbi:MAG: hypothetical protein QME48_01020 [bacterium]|uniref:Uncharacterized protein n=2 Tax=Bacteria candidate phyla TaxID=1783234 RepID=A0A124G0J3_UNCT6|nr:MAG: hypothetical protein XD76_0296 [candidate division TA06 bacterium 32_111]KUK87671.1 MAG: hypothetical protein XE03_0562 [candidate division TA06 bacterium 34_109]MDI6699805.1 hypothetical protein [bacterium]HAF07510.1 hypothetical protein [candidate division WOR-3 bacterium]HCP17579.1 hypothetical protein [candidate division WOR-3 bacterium]